MRIVTLEAHYFRNFQHIHVNPHPNYNILYGRNGSGKTSFLEAIHLLALGRSFRTHTAQRIINHQAEKLSVFAKIQDNTQQLIPIGIERMDTGDSQLKIAGNYAKTHEAAAMLPMQVLNNDSFFLIAGGPSYRRQFLDWGLFHVKPLFIDHWRKYQTALKQRNALLKQRAPLKELHSWDIILIENANIINQMRQDYIKSFLPVFYGILEILLPFENLKIIFHQGWPLEQDFAVVLRESLSRDLGLNHTYYGCHRADLTITLHDKPIVEVLSRGQQKLFVWAMRLAQGLELKQTTHKNCIFLMDDLTAELDPLHRNAVFSLLEKIEAQLFITGIVKEELRVPPAIAQGKMFHVKQGTLKEVV